MSELRIHITRDRLEKTVTLNEIIGVQDGDLRAIRDLMARFAINGEGNYLPDEDARELVGNLTLEQVNEAAADMQHEMEKAVVPFGSGTD